MAQSITDLKVGRVLNHDGEPYVIIWNNFMRTAMRKPVMRTKLRGVISGRVLDKTFTAGEAFELVHIQKSNAQYLYKDDDNAYFMDSKTYEQFPLPIEMLGDQMYYLKEGEETMVTRFEERPIGVELPPKVVLKVVDTPPGVRGDTAQGGTKPATLETGLTIQVPLFINSSDSVKVNTETNEYVERG
ncbi:elongation factor P [Candidatus Peregrinibacteria bacterium]|nr:elongation factor P [Candidatus Peregrinibacteria bacterium]